MTRAFAPISLLVILSGPAFLPGTAFGQTTPAAAALPPSGETLPAFDLADVHPSTHALTQAIRVLGARAPVLRASGRYEVTSASMLDLIKTAYNVDADKVLGGPSWLESDRFDIIAKAPAKTSPDTARLMLQTLLADRFKLVLHKDTHALPTYALSVGKGGHKLKETDGSGQPGCAMTIQQGSAIQASSIQSAIQSGTPLTLRVATLLYTCRNITMAAFADQMRTMTVAQAYIGNNPTADQTGLKGSWDFDFKYTPKPPAANNNQNNAQTLSTANGSVTITTAGEYITLFDAMEKQLGLKLDPVTLPIPVLIVDSVNRRPTDNPPEVTAKLPPPPSGEFEVAEIRLTPPGAPPGGSRGFQPNGQIELRNYPLRALISLAWDLPGVDSLADAPKWLEAVRIDFIAKTAPLGTPIDLDLIRPALRALLTDRFKVKIHTEMRPGNAWVLTATKPKLAKPDPADRTLCKDGPGKDGKDPRTTNPVLGRLVTCQNMTMTELAEQLPIFASGYFRGGEQVVNETGLSDAYDFTLSFSGAGLVPGAQRPVLNDGAVMITVGPAAAGANSSDPNGAVSLQEALSKQLGLKLEQQKRPVSTIVLDHVEEKPTE
jgi:uncharacterized protein (TIGR03435 family)